MYQMLCSRQQFTSLEQDDDDDDGPGLGDALPEIKFVQSAYRSEISEVTTLKGKSKEMSKINVGTMEIEKEDTSSPSPDRDAKLYKSQRMPISDKPEFNVQPTEVNPEGLNIMNEDSVNKAGWFVNDLEHHEKKPLLQELEDGEDYIGSSNRFNYEGHIEMTRQQQVIVASMEM